ncbi:MAG TPA: hypothetical protein VJY36_07985 [Candidatus Bathyarchaeia archaeon]|nr:hypothetical protein [Candidatus Bathyarchaeia archaeon]
MKKKKIDAKEPKRLPNELLIFKVKRESAFLAENNKQYVNKKPKTDEDLSTGAWKEGKMSAAEQKTYRSKLDDK